MRKSWLAALAALLFVPFAAAEARGNGPALSDPDAIAGPGDGRVVYVADSGDRTLKEVDLATGDRRVVADFSSYPGSFHDMDYSANGNALVVLTSRADIFVVSLADGTARKVAYTSPDPLAKQGEDLGTDTDIAVSADGHYAYRMDRQNRTEFAPHYLYNTLLKIDLATGETRQVRREPDLPSTEWIEPALDLVSSLKFGTYTMAMAPDGHVHMIGGSSFTDAWGSYDIDPATARTGDYLAGYGGNGKRSIRAFVEDGGWIYFADPLMHAVTRVALDTANWDDIAIFSGRENKPMGAPVGEGPVLVDPVDLALLGKGRLGVLDTYHKAVFAVDTATGARTLVSGETRPYTAEREPIDDLASNALCRMTREGGLSDIRQFLTRMNWELDDAYPRIVCAQGSYEFTGGVDDIDDGDKYEYREYGRVDLLKQSVMHPYGLGVPVSLARYYIRELDQPEKIARIYNTVETMPGFTSGTLLDFLHYFRDNPMYGRDWTQDELDRYDSTERLIRRFGGLTAAELEAKQSSQ